MEQDIERIKEINWNVRSRRKRERHKDWNEKRKSSGKNYRRNSQTELKIGEEVSLL